MPMPWIPPECSAARGPNFHAWAAEQTQFHSLLHFNSVSYVCVCVCLFILNYKVGTGGKEAENCCREW